MLKYFRFFSLVFFLIFFLQSLVFAEAIRELVDVHGVIPVQLEGIGIVTGLPGTGDKREAALEMLKKYLGNNKFDFDIKHLASGNIAFVRVTAELPPFLRPGQKFPVKVTSLGDAKNLSGGELLSCDLLGADGELYARATGQVIVGQNIQTRGIIPIGESSGAIQVGAYPFGKITFERDGSLYFRLNLKKPNAADAYSIANQINKTPSLNPYLEEGTMFEEATASEVIAWAYDMGQVVVLIPREHEKDQVRFLGEILNVPIAIDRPARIVVNRSKNSIVVTGDIKVNNAVVSLQDKTVTIQPATEDTPIQYAMANENPRSLIELEGPETFADLQSLIDTLNAMGLKTEQIITMFEELTTAGAIKAEFIGQ